MNISHLMVITTVVLTNGTSSGCNADEVEVSTMKDLAETIASVRAEFDAQIMRIDGVVSVSTGIDENGDPCLKIGTSLPVDEIREKLPDKVFSVPVQMQYQGDVGVQ